MHFECDQNAGNGFSESKILLSYIHIEWSFDTLNLPRMQEMDSQNSKFFGTGGGRGEGGGELFDQFTASEK